ncbi:MAG TPA: ATPase, T2SS/T4P/T4SS family [Hyphomicrobiaceae bacterium]|jgi:general secretion pathway protein E
MAVTSRASFPMAEGPGETHIAEIAHRGDGDLADSLGAFLAEGGHIDDATLDRARRAARTTGERFDRVLTKLGLLSETDLTAALSAYLSIPMASLAEVPAEPVLPDIVRADFVRRNRVLPLAVGEDSIAIGVTDPFSEEPLRALAYLIERSVSPRLLAPADFDKAYQTLYAPSGADADGARAGAGEASEIDVQRLRDMASEAPTIRLVNQVIGEAVEAQASDIHVEPTGDGVLVRYRIDGALRTVRTLATDVQAAVTSRLKIMARLDIAERRLPQDGRIKIAVRGIDIDFRMSTIPTAFGESVVLRILDRSRVELDFQKLGFTPELVAGLQDLMRQPNGIVLVTGPTGSGKTTTLYTALKMLNRPDRKLFTVEDPIEYQLERINQVQVHGAIGLDFPHALRSILRQDPDIIMIGEIRDLETARIAVQASLTGHLVFSTLHTNSAAASITRLVDMGIENYLLASTLRGVLAQRLVRRLCRQCCGPQENAEQWAKEIRRRVPGIDGLGAPDLRRATGCTACGNTGYSGRTTIAELMAVDAEVERLILSAASDADLEKAARSHGMLTMYEAGMAKVWTGATTIDEVLSATRAG